MSNLSFKNTLKKQCELFREAIERTPKQGLIISLKDFPEGSCGDAVLLLGHFLTAKGFGKFDYMVGNYVKKDKSYWGHAWLQQRDLIIDITADQFEDFKEGPVFVGLTSDWHNMLEDKEKPHEADFEVYNHPNCLSIYHELKNSYSRIMRILEET